MILIGKIILFFIFAINFYSQTVVRAFVDKQVVPINESFNITISISGDNINNPKIDISVITDFNIYSSGSSSNISIINGHISTSYEYTYTLIPKRTGHFIIPKIPIFTGREKYFTSEIPIEVTKPNIASQPKPQQQTQIKPTQRTPRKNLSSDEMMFVEAKLDKSEAYQGEQVTLSVKFYTAVPISANPNYLPPTFTNLVAEELPPIRTGTEIINGIRYYYAEIKTALFPIMEGEASISPATVVVYTQPSIDDIDPFDPNFIQKFFSQSLSGKEVKLTSNPIKIKVKSLPKPPSNFNNAIGNFFITAKISDKTAYTGSAINLIIEITGKGNVKSIVPPTLNLKDFKIYDTLTSETISKNNDIVGGTKKITYIISPLKEGDLEIDPIPFVFFNIDTHKYETLYTQPIKIKVLKGETGKSIDFDTSKSSLEITKKSSDINYIYEKIPNSFFTRFSIYVYKISTYLNIFLVLILIINYIILKRKQILLTNPSEYLFKNALSNFKHRLKSIKINDKNSLAILYDSIYDYISAKTGKNLSHLTFSKIEEEIKNIKPNFSNDLIKELNEIIEKIEFINYTKSEIKEDEFKNIIEKSLDIISKFEKEFEKWKK